jgi:hypothetical protein
MRFTIRDVFWLTAVVAVLMGWILTSLAKEARYKYLLNRYTEILKYAPPEYKRGIPSTDLQTKCFHPASNT